MFENRRRSFVNTSGIARVRKGGRRVRDQSPAVRILTQSARKRCTRVQGVRTVDDADVHGFAKNVHFRWL